VPEYFDCPHLGGSVELTDERRAHINLKHPEFADGLDEAVARVLDSPKVLRRSILEPRELLFARRIGRADRHFVVAVIVTDERRVAPEMDRDGTVREAALPGERPTENGRTMALSYDSVGDILYVDLAPRHAGQESEMLDGENIARFDCLSGRAENFDVLHFRQRVERGEVVTLPLDAVLATDEE
jgi:hypothetical protein